MQALCIQLFMMRCKKEESQQWAIDVSDSTTDLLARASRAPLSLHRLACRLVRRSSADGTVARQTTRD